VWCRNAIPLGVWRHRELFFYWLSLVTTSKWALDRESHDLIHYSPTTRVSYPCVGLDRGSYGWEVMDWRPGRCESYCSGCARAAVKASCVCTACVRPILQLWQRVFYAYPNTTNARSVRARVHSIATVYPRDRSKLELG
jgi:hypothetical protein